MLRVERIKPNIYCVSGFQFKPGITEISDVDAIKLMKTRQFTGAIANGDMRILERPESQQPKVAEEAIKPKQRRKSKSKSPVSQKTVLKMINGCTSIEDLEGMFKSQKDDTVRKAVKSRIAFLTVPDPDENTE